MDSEGGESDHGSDDDVDATRGLHRGPLSARAGDHDDAADGAERADDVGVSDKVAEDLASVAADIDLGCASEGHAPDILEVASDARGSGDPAPPLPPPLEPPPDKEPWELLHDPSPLGYIYENGRAIMRVQRGKPKSSATINCYLHTSCHLCLGLRRCPDNAALKRWLFELGRPAEGISHAEMKALSQEHMRLGKSRWGARAPGAAA